MHEALHPRDDVDRLYVSRKEGGRGLASIEDTVDASIQLLKDYIEKHERGLITTIIVDTDNTINERMTTTRKQKWEGKQLYGRFKRLINNISHQKTWTWLRQGNIKRETKSLLIAAQDNALRTNHIKARIHKTQQNSKCRLYSDRDETVKHIISECSKLAQKKYNNKRTCKIVDFAVPADHRRKLEECEKKDKYLDLTRELKKLWNMQVTIIPIVIGGFGTINKELLKGLEDLDVGRRVETIQTTAWLRTARILRVLDT